MENYSSLENQHGRFPVGRRLTLKGSTGRLARIKLFNFGEDTCMSSTLRSNCAQPPPLVVFPDPAWPSASAVRTLVVHPSWNHENFQMRGNCVSERRDLLIRPSQHIAPETQSW